MAFSLNKKATASKMTELWKVEHITTNEVVTVVLEEPLAVEQNKIDRDILLYLEKMLLQELYYV